jgi:hypothetical protein
MCKDKWRTFFGEFKKKFNYMLKTIHNEDYWAMNLQGKATFHLPQLFNEYSYDVILEFVDSKRNFIQPHMHDLMKDLKYVYKHLNINNTFDKKD